MRHPDGRQTQRVGEDLVRQRAAELTSSEGFASDFLPTAMADFRLIHPGIDFNLAVLTPGEATRRVRDGDADLALTFSLAPEKGVKVEHTERAPVFALTHPQMRQRSIQVQTMAGRELPASVRAFRDFLIAAIRAPQPARTRPMP
jgi:DNA-binding transcriptional LysR family regulator